MLGIIAAKCHFRLASDAVRPRQPTSRDALAMPRFCTRVVPRRFLRDTWESWSCDSQPLKSANIAPLVRRLAVLSALPPLMALGLRLAAHPACRLHNVLAACALVSHDG